MQSNALMVERLREQGLLKSKRATKAFLRVDRADFVPASLKDLAYEDRPLPTTQGQTISAPSIVALMTEALDARPGMKVLEIGSGSGYQAAILAQCVGGKGRVFTVESNAALYDYAKQKLGGYGNVEVFLADGSLGLKSKAPFHRIMVTAAAPAIPPALFEQLMEGGKMVAPVGATPPQKLLLVQKIEGKQVVSPLSLVLFVPLKGAQGFKPSKTA
ncbi:MAG: protein-L-isoaspartate(D-aspartate) O-methyltransferase [Candidatus Micrarchaeia archaeon]